MANFLTQCRINRWMTFSSYANNSWPLLTKWDIMRQMLWAMMAVCWRRINAFRPPSRVFRMTGMKMMPAKTQRDSMAVKVVIKVGFASLVIWSSWRHSLTKRMNKCWNYTRVRSEKKCLTCFSELDIIEDLSGLSYFLLEIRLNQVLRKISNPQDYCPMSQSPKPRAMSGMLIGCSWRWNRKG